MDAATRTRLDKAAQDNGFDDAGATEAGWVRYASTRAPLAVALGRDAGGPLVVAFSQRHVADALELGTPWEGALPSGMVAARGAGDFEILHDLLRRAFELSRSLPDEPLRAFEAELAEAQPPSTTEIERLVRQRVGQDVFRERLLDFWERRCALTGLEQTSLLRASHIKPWADCASDAERLDVYNGLLLAPHLDAAFDAGFITFDERGALVCAESLSVGDRERLGLTDQLSAPKLRSEHHYYLRWHRERVFRR
jgi:hypothetical protein